MRGMSQMAREFTGYACGKLRDHLAQIRRCVMLLRDEEAWHRANEHSNSVMNLVLHLTGNLRQWIGGGIDGQTIARNRQGEFDARSGPQRSVAVEMLSAVVEEACGVIGRMDEAALTRGYEIQTYRVSGIEAVMHVVEHFAFHTGQIVTTTKWLRDVDLSLYDERGHRRDGRKDDVP